MTTVTYDDIDHCLDVVHPGVERCAECPDNGTLGCVQRIRDEDVKQEDDFLVIQERSHNHLSSCC